MKPRLASCVAGRGVTLLRSVFDGAPAGCINLGLGQPTDPVPDSVRTASIRAMETGFAPYGPTAGLTSLREAVGARVYPGSSADNVLITGGSQEALWVALMGLVNRDEDVLIPEPGYPAYRVVTEMIGARPITVPLSFDRRFGLDPAAVDRAWTERTRALVVASPSNPTGMAVGDRGVLERLYAMCAERDAWLIADEVYGRLLYGEPGPPLYALGERVVALGGISKHFNAMGHRIGWVRAEVDVIHGLTPLHQQVALCAPYVGQQLALACLDLWTDEYFATLNERYRRRRAAACDALGQIAGVRFHEPDGAFYVFVDVSRYTTDTLALALRLRDEMAVITAPGEAFGDAGRGFLRISFATEPERVREGIGRIAEYLGKLA